MKNKTIFRELKQIKLELVEINKRLSVLVNPRPLTIDKDNFYEKLLFLPDKLRRTYLVVLDKNEVSATDVSKISKYKRAIESSHLNELVRLGYLRKKKVSRNTIFYI